jgi:mannose-6-phosphate isomerase-like protein (cupin superfamily)
VRRVVTGSDADGRSYVVTEERVPATGVAKLFRTSAENPLGPGISGDHRIRSAETINLDVRPGGSELMFWTVPPSTSAAKPTWHRTESLDYDMILSGELILMLDKGEVTLHAGDVVIQRNTHHAWRNPSTRTPATAWVVNIGLQPSLAETRRNPH